MYLGIEFGSLQTNVHRRKGTTPQCRGINFLVAQLDDPINRETAMYYQLPLFLFNSNPLSFPHIAFLQKKSSFTDMPLKVNQQKKSTIDFNVMKG